MPPLMGGEKHRAPGSRGWLVAVAATLGMSVSYVDRQTLAAIAPAVRAGLHIDHAHFGWLVSAFSMAYFVFAPISGHVVDRLGARKGFALAVVAWTCVAAAHSLATSFASLFVLRILLGMTEAPSFPAAAQSIRRALPGTTKSAGFGLLFTGSSIGAMVATPLAVAIDARWGFRMAFVVTAVLGTMWIPFWLFATRGGALDATAPGGAATTTEPLPSTLAILRSAPVLRSVVAIVGSAPALMFVINWTPQYLVEAWKIPKEGIGLYALVPLGLFDLGAVGFGWLASRRTPRGESKTQTDLFVLALALALVLVLVPVVARGPGVAVVMLGLAAMGGGGIYVLVTADMLSRVPVARTSTAGAFTAAAQSLAHIVAAPLVGKSIDATGGFTVALLALGAIVLPTTLVFLVWPVAPPR